MASRGDRLNQAIKGRGITKMLSLAIDLRVHESAISRWRKDAPMTLDHAAKLSEALNISLDWLVLGRGHMDGHNVESLRSGEAELLQSLRRLKRGALPLLNGFLEEILSEP
jgi:transcriptional regulator with XRE-family HTH domain